MEARIKALEAQLSELRREIQALTAKLNKFPNPQAIENDFEKKKAELDQLVQFANEQFAEVT